MDGIHSMEQEILLLAQRAASSHNSQPWTLEQDCDGSYVVKAERDRWLSEVDPDKRELLLSLGAYLENLRIAAECFGYHADIRILMADRADTDIARFTLDRLNGDRNDRRILLMKNSSMAKVKYRKTMDRRDLLLSLLEKQGHAVWIDRSEAAFDYVVKATADANRRQAWSDEKQRELAGYICFSTEDEDSGVGMTPRMLNLPWFMSRSWYEKAGPESVMSKMFRNGAAAKAEKLMKNCAGVILMTSPDDSAPSLLECGGRFQRLYWECKERDIELHTVSQILEESPWKDELAERVTAMGPIQFVLRAGETGKGAEKADAVGSASIRMPVSGAGAQ